MKSEILFKTYPDFPVAGVNFIDLTPSILNPKIRRKLIVKLAELYGYRNCSDFEKEIDYIISPDARGFIWGGMIAEKYGVGLIPVRKPGKLPDKAIGAVADYKTEYSTTTLCIPKVDLEGKKLLFVDDVYATGGTYRAIKKLVSSMKGDLLGGAVVVDLELDDNKEIKSLVKAKGLIG